MKILITILAIMPVICFLSWIYTKDRYDKEPVMNLLKYFALGVVVSLISISVEKYLIVFDKFNGVFSKIYISFVVAALTEELIKFIILISTLIKEKYFNEKLDGIIYSVSLSLGFATVENIIYLMREKVELSVELSLSRGLISIPAHIMFAITMGYYISKFKFEENKDKKIYYLIKSILMPILLHGIFDFILMIGNRWAIIIFIVYVVYLWKVNLDKLEKYTLYSKIRFYKKKYKHGKGDKID